MSDPALYADGLTYAWIIDEDHLDSGDDSVAGTTGPHNALPRLLSYLSIGHGRQFRMYDDDGELYYEGRIVFGDASHYQGETESHFAPLNDFGTPSAGACEIQYRISGEWTAL